MQIGVVDITNDKIFSQPLMQGIQNEVIKSVETCSPSKSLEKEETERGEISTVEGSIKGFDENLTKGSYRKLKKPSS